MKKSFNFISIFFMMITMVGSLLLVKSSNVKAESILGIDEGETKTFINDGNNKVTISSGGAITIQYEKNHGYSELLVVATKCKDWIDKNDHSKGCDGYEGFDGGNAAIIHLSGDYYSGGKFDADNNELNTITKTIHLFNYFDYDTLLRVQIYTEFFSGTKLPLVCNRDAVNEALKDECGNKTSIDRVDKYIDKLKSTGYISNAETFYVDRKYLIYDVYGLGGDITDAIADLSNNKTILDDTVVIVNVDNTKVSGASGDVEKLIYDTLIPTAITILLIAAGVAIAVLGYQIIKSSDEPQERQEKIRTLRNILIGIGIALLLLFIIEPFVNLIKGNLE